MVNFKGLYILLWNWYWITNLVDYYYKGDLFEAVVKATSKLEGALLLELFLKWPDKIIAVRKDSPLIVGLGKMKVL